MLAFVRFLGVAVCSFLLAACGSDDADDDGASSGQECPDDPSGGSCDGSPCGGDIVGTWKLVTFCAPSCVSSVYETVTFGADGSYNDGQGTWEYKSDDTFEITVGAGSSVASFCASGGTLWTQHGTNCGAESGPVSILRVRGSCSEEGEPPR